ncbi:hypothetical protein B0H11DRAFT_2215087 [Mycena galericulata]|nr:hypothetical protein B0H11DRAFT_2215087 [Mycena galericulata]
MTDHNNLAPAASSAAGASLASIHAALHDLALAVDAIKVSTAMVSTSSVADISSALAGLNDAADAIGDATDGVFAAVTGAPAQVFAAIAAAAAPAPAPAAGPAAGGFTRATAPWVAGTLYSVIPLAPLQAIPDNGEKWFAITRGKYVGLTKNSAISINAVTGVPGALMEKFSGQADALEYFNGALLSGAAAAFRPPDSPENTSRLYYWRSTTGSGYTHDWEFAAAQTQGMPGGTSTRLTPKHKTRVKKGGFAVFVGKEIGSFENWRDVQPLVKGIPNSIFQGYRTLSAATATFEYARDRSWTRRAARALAAPSTSPPTAIPQLPTPTGLFDAHNPLHGDNSEEETDHLWYVVYCGITPGVEVCISLAFVRSRKLSGVLSLECLLNTVGISGARFDSCDSKEVALYRYQTALSGGRVKVLSPMYYP